MEKLELERAKADAASWSAALNAYKEAVRVVIGHHQGGPEALEVIERMAASLTARGARAKGQLRSIRTGAP